MKKDNMGLDPKPVCVHLHVSGSGLGSLTVDHFLLALGTSRGMHNTSEDQVANSGLGTSWRLEGSVWGANNKAGEPTAIVEYEQQNQRTLYKNTVIQTVKYELQDWRTMQYVTVNKQGSKAGVQSQRMLQPPSTILTTKTT